MKPNSIRNKGGVPFLTLKGIFVVRNGQMPDGDTLAFAATAPFGKVLVKTNVPVNTTGIETVNIRLQSIDAPEKSQPLGARARDTLLKYLKFRPSSLGLSDINFTANGGTVMRPGWIATHGLDGNGRPLGYIFRENSNFTHGQEVSAEKVLAAIKSSANYAQALSGAAFPAFYENTDETHAVLFKQGSDKARIANKGVWSTDATTTGFVPTKDALNIDGILVYPKFYRRVESWNDAKPNAKAFIAWLKTQVDGKKLVQGAERSPIPLWQLFVVVSKSRVSVPYDVAKLWFSE